MTILPHSFSDSVFGPAVRWLGIFGVLLIGCFATARGEEVVVQADSSARAAHALLTQLCDDFGPRPVGSVANNAAMERLAVALRAIGLQPEYIRFKMPGWERGEDRVDLVAPIKRKLRVAALAYTQTINPFEAEIVSVGEGKPKEFPANAKGAIGLVDGVSRESMRELVKLANASGLRGLLLINRVSGGQLLARTGSFVGEPLSIPAFSITAEEGGWLKRLLERGRSVRVRVETKSSCRQVETANLVVRLRGRSSEMLVVGAHFDSVDLGQGAIDNGLGVAQLFALAHAWRKHLLPRTVELVWFNGEELGLWGSRHYVSLLNDTQLVAMANLDMTGVPIAINAMGEETLLPILERWHLRSARPLEKGVINNAWFGGDHIPFQQAGYRAFTFHGPIDQSDVRYYHDFGDTVEKVTEKLVVDSVSIISTSLLALLGDKEMAAWRRTPEETRALFKKLGYDERIRAVSWDRDQ